MALTLLAAENAAKARGMIAQSMLAKYHTKAPSIKLPQVALACNWAAASNSSAFRPAWIARSAARSKKLTIFSRLEGRARQFRSWSRALWPRVWRETLRPARYHDSRRRRRPNAAPVKFGCERSVKPLSWVSPNKPSTRRIILSYQSPRRTTVAKEFRVLSC